MVSDLGYGSGLGPTEVAEPQHGAGSLLLGWTTPCRVGGVCGGQGE